MIYVIIFPGVEHMSYEITLDNFQGPLDLLLHLIKEKEMDLETLDLSLLADQYLDYINKVDDRLEIMSEYLVMATTLVEMKSKTLLPREKITIDDEYQEDPTQQLIRRLIEYKKYKDISETFKDRYEKRNEMYTKAPSSMNEYNIEIKIEGDLEVYDLLKAMQKLYARKALTIPLESKVTRVEISIEERSKQIMDYFNHHHLKSVSFGDLIDRGDCNYFIVTFLSVLTLVKDHYLNIKQSYNFDEIIVEAIIDG